MLAFVASNPHVAKTSDLSICTRVSSSGEQNAFGDHWPSETELGSKAS